MDSAVLPKEGVEKQERYANNNAMGVGYKYSIFGKRNDQHSQIGKRVRKLAEGFFNSTNLLGELGEWTFAERSDRDVVIRDEVRAYMTVHSLESCTGGF